MPLAEKKMPAQITMGQFGGQAPMVKRPGIQSGAIAITDLPNLRHPYRDMTGMILDIGREESWAGGVSPPLLPLSTLKF